MTHGFLRGVCSVALTAGVVCVVVLIALRAFSAREPLPDLASVFGAPPCAAPCWRGITPGQTELDSAISGMEREPDVASLVVNVGSATWAWNGAQPEILGRGSLTFDGRLVFASDAPEEPVRGMAVITSLTLGDILLARGEPLAHALYLPPDSARPGAVYAAVYPDATIFAPLSCPITTASFWAAPVGVSFGAVDLSLGGETRSMSATDVSAAQWAAQVCTN